MADKSDLIALLKDLLETELREDSEEDKEEDSEEAREEASEELPATLETQESTLVKMTSSPRRVQLALSRARR